MRVVYLAIMQGIKPSSIRASRRTADHACTSTDTNIDHILILHPPAHVRSQIIGIRFITAWCQKFYEACWDVVNTCKPEDISAIQESTLISNVVCVAEKAKRVNVDPGINSQKGMEALYGVCHGAGSDVSSTIWGSAAGSCGFLGFSVLLAE